MKYSKNSYIILISIQKVSVDKNQILYLSVTIPDKPNIDLRYISKISWIYYFLQKIFVIKRIILSFIIKKKWIILFSMFLFYFLQYCECKKKWIVHRKKNRTGKISKIFVKLVLMTQTKIYKKGII